jgi:type IV pilus assembly protein PilB
MPEISHSRVGVTTRLSPSGPLSNEEAVSDLQEALYFCIAAHETQIALDLSSVPLVNGHALEVMLDVQDHLAKLGGGLRIAVARPIIQEILVITGIVNHIAVEGMDPKVAELSRPDTKRSRKLGDILRERGLVSNERIEEAVRQQTQTGARLGHIMLEKRWLSEQDLLGALSEQIGLPLVWLRPGIYDPAAIGLVSKETATRLTLLPLFKIRGVITLATADPQSILSFDEVESLTGCKVQPVLARREEIYRSINEAYAATHHTLAEYIGDLDEDFQILESTLGSDYAAIDEIAAGSPVINLINAVIQRAVRDGASDIHIEPGRSKSRIRLRIDGVLYEIMSPPMELHPALVSRLKVMANLDIAERRLPQDGRIQVQTQGRAVDLRFSSLPGINGEKIVLRVLDKRHTILDIDKLAMRETNLALFKRLLKRGYGLLLATGPTGSGKTTTLYAALSYLNSLEKNIVTIEDPVEYQLDIVNQNEVRSGIGLGFAKMLRHVLRQDPDIIMVGEIRDRETAEIAVQAALTGHLVLSTLHTNDSVGAVTRLFEMGVEPYLLSSALIGVIAQRLIRTVCPECKVAYLAPPEVITRFHWNERDSVRLFKGRGCPACYDSGYKGRIAIHEILEVDGDLQKLMIGNPDRDALERYVSGRNLQTLFTDGLERVLQGSTTIEEVSRAINA